MDLHTSRDLPPTRPAPAPLPWILPPRSRLPGRVVGVVLPSLEEGEAAPVRVHGGGSQQRRQIAQRNPKAQNSKVSKPLGAQWKLLTEDQE